MTIVISIGYDDNWLVHDLACQLELMLRVVLVECQCSWLEMGLNHII